MRLALFDLDHTLIPFDSGMAWTRHLVRAGALDANAEDDYLAYCHQYVAGTLDIHAMHRASMAPLAGFALEQLLAWRVDFEREVESLLPGSASALVRQHRECGDLCAIVTATSRWVAEPFARVLRVEHLLATDSVEIGGKPGPEIRGQPCYREHKLSRVHEWLATLGPAAMPLADFERSWFYSDSTSDLPLLQAVSDPVAVCPDAKLRAIAIARGWRIVDST